MGGDQLVFKQSRIQKQMKLKISLVLIVLSLILSSQSQPVLALPPNLAVITADNIDQLRPYAGFSSSETELLVSIGFDANSHLLGLYDVDGTFELRDLSSGEL